MKMSNLNHGLMVYVYRSGSFLSFKDKSVSYPGPLRRIFMAILLPNNEPLNSFLILQR
jgi:hypothetical protein